MFFDHSEENLIFFGSDPAPAEESPVAWAPSDCYFDPADPYNPCGPHHAPPPKRSEEDSE